MPNDYKLRTYRVSEEADSILLKNANITNSFVMDIYDKLRKQRLYIISLLATLAVTLTALIIILFLKPRIVPYVVVLNEKEYEITKMGTISNRGDVLSDNTKKNVVKYFIKSLRTISIDVNIVKNNITELGYIVTNNGRTFVENIISTQPEYKNIGALIRQISVKSIFNVGADPNIYQIDWIESYGEYTGTSYTEKGTKSMRAIIKIIIAEPTIENPLGIYIDKIDMGEVL